MHFTAQIGIEQEHRLDEGYGKVKKLQLDCHLLMTMQGTHR